MYHTYNKTTELKKTHREVITIPPDALYCISVDLLCGRAHAKSPTIAVGRVTKEENDLCLVGERKIFRYHIGCFVGCRKGFSDTNKKTNYIACLETKRRIY
jgi:hypothetical protein